MQACEYIYKSKRMVVSGIYIFMIIGRAFQVWTAGNSIVHFTFHILFIQSDMKVVGAQTYFKHHGSSQMKDINLKNICTKVNVGDKADIVNIICYKTLRL